MSRMRQGSEGDAGASSESRSERRVYGPDMREYTSRPFPRCGDLQGTSERREALADSHKLIPGPEEYPPVRIVRKSRRQRCVRQDAEGPCRRGMGGRPDREGTEHLHRQGVQSPLLEPRRIHGKKAISGGEEESETRTR